MKAARRLLPALVATTALLSLSAGVVSAADLRGDERREERIAAQKRAVDAYRAQVLPVAVEAFDLVQPLQQAFADLDNGVTEAIDVVLDVSRFLAVDDALVSARDRLEAITAPADQSGVHDDLLTGLTGFRDAAVTTRAMDDTDDGVDLGEIIASGDFELDRATAVWERAVRKLYDGKDAPPAPVRSGAAGPRAPLSHGSYLRDVGTICLVGLDATGREAEPTTEQISASLVRLDQDVMAMTAVPTVPGDEAEVQQSIREPLGRTRELGTGFERGVAASRRGDVEAARESVKELARGELASEKAAAGLRAYGSQICALYLVGPSEQDVDLDEDTARPA